MRRPGPARGRGLAFEAMNMYTKIIVIGLAVAALLRILYGILSY